VPESNGAEYLIGYSTQGKGLVKLAFVTASHGITVFSAYAGDFSVTLSSGQYIDIDLVAGVEISGEISLPSTAPAGGLKLAVFTTDRYELGVIEPVIIPQGARTVNYILTVPQNSDFYLGYMPVGDNAIYYEGGFYSNYQTVQNFYNASFINSGYYGQSNINMKVISKAGVVLPTPIIPLPGIPDPNAILPVGITATPTPTKKATATPTKIATATPTSTQKSEVSSTPAQPSPYKLDLSKLPKDAAKHWARENIAQLIDRGFVSGYKDGTIKPNNNINRAEITKLIAKMLDLQPSQNPNLKFSDSKKIPDWAKGYIQVVTEKGIIMGYDDKTFRAGNNLSRMEMAVIVLRALGYNDLPKKPLKFTDASLIPGWAAGYVAEASELGILQGYENGSFGPKNSITRGEAFTVILRSIELKKQ
jgi:hypothetical protein